MKQHILTLIAGLLLTATVSGPARAAGPISDFQYQNAHSLAVDLALTALDGHPLLVSFYSQGVNGQRFLQNAFTDAQGHFIGEIQLPNHISEIVVVVRGGDHQKTLTLPLVNDMISYFEPLS